MSISEERIANLRRASAMTRYQDQMIQDQLNSMNDEQVNSLLDNDESLRDMLTISADDSDNSIVVNYAEQPQNSTEISYKFPWEGNLSSVPTTNYNISPVNLFQTPMTQYQYGNDPRVQNYKPGMKFYNLNPYSFYDEKSMLDYYDYLENERRKQQDEKYFWCKLYANLSGDKQAMEWAKSFKFKTADQIIKETEEERKRIEEERYKELYGEDGSNTVYNVYDANGYKIQRVCSFKIVSKATGEVVFEKKYRKDENGQSYDISSINEDRRREYEIQEINNALINQARCQNNATNIFQKAYRDNIQKWNNWREQGLTTNEMWARWEDERIDWDKHAKLLDRALRSTSYSKERFNDILKRCCHCELDYANRSNFFSLSYDFERDLHYKKLISTPEEMQNDPLVHCKLKQEYDIKRKLFMDKVNSGNLGCDMQIDAHYHPTFPKPNIDSLTLEDFNKPENQTMYTQIVTPHLATPNVFIPNELSKPEMTNEELNKLCVNLDTNGQPIAQQRTFGVMTVDDDTGQIISQKEYDVTNITDKIADMNNISDDELKNIGF